MKEEQYCNYLSICLLECAGKLNPSEHVIKIIEEQIYGLLVSVKKIDEKQHYKSLKKRVKNYELN